MIKFRMWLTGVEIKEMQEEVERLKQEARFTAISVLPEKDAEIARLRAALNAISCSVYGVDTMQSIARAALEEKP